MPGPDFIEIGSDDPAKAMAFYSAVFGWRFEGQGDTGDTGGMATDGERRVGVHGNDAPLMVPYLPVKDMAIALAAVKANGGTVMGEVADEGPLGSFATCQDPSGARFGLHKPSVA